MLKYSKYIFLSIDVINTPIYHCTLYLNFNGLMSMIGFNSSILNPTTTVPPIVNASSTTGITASSPALTSFEQQLLEQQQDDSPRPLGSREKRDVRAGRHSTDVVLSAGLKKDGRDGWDRWIREGTVTCSAIKDDGQSHTVFHERIYRRKWMESSTTRVVQGTIPDSWGDVNCNVTIKFASGNKYGGHMRPYQAFLDKKGRQDCSSVDVVVNAGWDQGCADVSCNKVDANTGNESTETRRACYLWKKV